MTEEGIYYAIQNENIKAIYVIPDFQISFTMRLRFDISFFRSIIISSAMPFIIKSADIVKQEK
mgnify:CR=1 FL=1